MLQSLVLSGKKGDSCSALSFPESAALNGKLEKHNLQYQPLHEASPTFDPDEFDTSSSVAFESLLILFWSG